MLYLSVLSVWTLPSLLMISIPLQTLPNIVCFPGKNHFKISIKQYQKVLIQIQHKAKHWILQQSIAMRKQRWSEINITEGTEMRNLQQKSHAICSLQTIVNYNRVKINPIPEKSTTQKFTIMSNWSKNYIFGCLFEIYSLQLKPQLACARKENVSKYDVPINYTIKHNKDQSQSMI